MTEYRHLSRQKLSNVQPAWDKQAYSSRVGECLIIHDRPCILDGGEPSYDKEDGENDEGDQGHGKGEVA